MRGFFRSMASASWTTTRRGLVTSASSPRAFSEVEETTQRWACLNGASGLKTSSSTVASRQSHHLHYYHHNHHHHCEFPFRIRNALLTNKCTGTCLGDRGGETQQHWRASQYILTEMLQGQTDNRISQDSARHLIDTDIDRLYR